MSRNPHLIRSDRLDLVLLDLKALEYSLAEDLKALEDVLGVDVPPDWFRAKDLIELRYQQIIRVPAYQPWSLRAIVLREDGMMIGHIGFHTGPGASYLHSFAPNGIEFGFTVFQDYRRKGYAKEAALALMGWAYEEHGISEFVLTIRPDNVPSLKLAQRFGFKKIGSHVDEVDGVEDIFRLEFGQSRQG